MNENELMLKKHQFPLFIILNPLLLICLNLSPLISLNLSLLLSL